MGISTLASSMFPSMSIPINSSMSVSVSPMIGLGEYGLAAGMSVGLNYNFGDDWNFRLSGGGGNQYYGGNFSFSYKDWGAGYGLTHYYDQKIDNVNSLGSQNVGTISALLGGVSVRFSNDAVGDHEDRWRSNAVEIAYKKFSIGTYVTTNDGSDASGGKNTDGFVVSDIEGRDKGEWLIGEVYSAPLWFGFKYDNQVYRFGYSCAEVQDCTQNFVHKHIAPTPLFTDYNYLRKGAYVYSGYDSPYSLW